MKKLVKNLHSLLLEPKKSETEKKYYKKYFIDWFDLDARLDNHTGHDFDVYIN